MNNKLNVRDTTDGVGGKETIEEAAQNYSMKQVVSIRRCSLRSFEAGAVWQAQQEEKRYTEEDMLKAYSARNVISSSTGFLIVPSNKEFEQWLKTYNTKQK